jgi:voltage-dependent calcium channel L type alpha-1D
VNAVLSSLPALFNVGVLLAFAYLVFAILAIDVWSDQYHRHCRLTEFPVQLNFDPRNASARNVFPNQTWIDVVMKDPQKYACPRTDVSSGIWATPEACFWPIDPDDRGFYCGARSCGASTYCGSNYDIQGNPRFHDIYMNDEKVFSIMDEPDFVPSLNFGLTSFDSVGRALIVIMQIVTASGWMALTQNVRPIFLFYRTTRTEC